MATVRIYRVAELLNTTSQEVMALLKRDHGIEVKSASSTIEEVVGRQFVDRLARQRGISLPSGDIFAEGAAAKAAPRKAAPGRKGAAAEPPKPAAPTLGPPRLIKAAKAIHQAERAAALEQAETETEAGYEPAEHAVEDHVAAPALSAEELPVAEAAPAPEPAVEAVEAAEPAPPSAAPDEHEVAPAAESTEPEPQAPVAPPPSGVVHQPAGRVVPP